jgi:hypothetical protein
MRSTPLERQGLVLVDHVGRGQALVLVEAEVADQDHQIDRRPEQRHVLLDRLAIGDRPDAQRVAALEDAGHRRPVGHPDDADLDAVEIEDRVRRDHVLERRRVGVDRVLEQVVRGQERKAGPVGDLLVEVDRAQVELVVADHRGVHPGLGQRPHLGLALEQVEHRRALEAVARVEPQRPPRGRADLLGQGRDLGHAAERAVGQDQAVVALEAVGDELVGEQPRVDVRGVDEGQPDVLAGQVGRLALDRAAGGQGGERRGRRGDGRSCGAHEAVVYARRRVGRKGIPPADRHAAVTS